MCIGHLVNHIVKNLQSDLHSCSIWNWEYNQWRTTKVVKLKRSSWTVRLLILTWLAKWNGMQETSHYIKGLQAIMVFRYPKQYVPKVAPKAELKSQNWWPMHIPPSTGGSSACEHNEYNQSKSWICFQMLLYYYYDIVLQHVLMKHMIDMRLWLINAHH